MIFPYNPWFTIIFPWLSMETKTDEIPWLNRLQRFPPAPVQWPSTERSEPEPVEAGPFSGFHGISGKNRTCLFNNSFIRPKCPNFVTIPWLFLKFQLGGSEISEGFSFSFRFLRKMIRGTIEMVNS